MTGTFTAGAVLTASNLNTAINSLTLNAQSGAGYTLVLADAGKLVTVSNASAQNLTIPLNSSVAYATGTVIEVLNIGSATWTLVPTGGVTLTGSTSIPTSARVRLTKTGTDTWYANTLGGGGLTFITSTTFSAVGSVSVNNCFSSTYDNYRIMVSLTSASGTDINVFMRARNAAADDTGANYAWEIASGFGASVGGDTAASDSGMKVGFVTTTLPTYATISLDVYNPKLATQTVLSGSRTTQTSASVLYTSSTAGWYKSASAHDGFTLYPASGTFGGTLYVFGYAKS